jgi:hypothetical protein
LFNSLAPKDSARAAASPHLNTLLTNDEFIPTLLTLCFHVWDAAVFSRHLQL